MGLGCFSIFLGFLGVKKARDRFRNFAFNSIIKRVVLSQIEAVLETNLWRCCLDQYLLGWVSHIIV